MPCNRLIKNIAVIAIVLSIIGTDFISPRKTDAAYAGCKASTSSLIDIQMSALKTLHNVFPIRIAGYKVFNFKDLDDFNEIGHPIICICTMPPPLFIRIGIPLSLWEPVDMIETVQHPWCSPSVGMQLPVPFNVQSLGGESSTDTQVDRTASAQIHLISYPVWAVVQIFVDFACLQLNTGFDYLYLTELDPLWQNDMWATLLGPEAYLTANPIAQFACSIDAATATAGLPLDYLYWCAGAWGGAYPMSKNAPSVGYLQANAELAAKFIAKMHREMVLWITSGPYMVKGTCQAFPFPIWKKSQYGLLNLYPISGKNRQPIGRSSLLWGAGKNPPMISSDFVWMLYRKRDCCAF